MDTISEMLTKIPMVKEEDEKKKVREEYQAGYLTTAAKLIEARIQKYGAGKGFAPSPSVADFFLLGVVNFFGLGRIDYIDTKFFESFPGIMYVRFVCV